MTTPKTTGFLLRYTLQGLFLLFLVAGILWYGSFQARNLIAGPEITLTPELNVNHTERIIPIAGTTKNIVELTLNGLPIYTDELGAFSVPLVLQNGYTIMTLRAKDRFGREVTLTRPLVYTPSFASK